jgi:hypothetical protein
MRVYASVMQETEQRLGTVNWSMPNCCPSRAGSCSSRLQDGRQLEGQLLVLTSRYQVGDEVFASWEIEELEDLG